MRRWCAKLTAYKYSNIYGPGIKISVLKRLPLPATQDEPHQPGDVLLLEALTRTPITVEKPAEETKEDALCFACVRRSLGLKVQKPKEGEILTFKRKNVELATK